MSPLYNFVLFGIFADELDQFSSALQGALKLKITMKGPKKEDLEKTRCEKTRRNLTKKIKANCDAKVNCCFNRLLFPVNNLAIFYLVVGIQQ